MKKPLNFSNEIITDDLVILIDEALLGKTRFDLKKLKTTTNKGLIFLDDKILAYNLENILNNLTKNETDILFVFPGNGSNYPRKLSKICGKYPSTSVKAKRIWEPGTDPVTIVDIILPEMFLIINVKTIVIVDDVISSGSTMRKLYQKNYWRFPQAKWIGASWVSQNLENGIKGYEYLETSCVVKKINKGKVPINSLSTLRSDLEIARSYAERHFEEPAKFLKLIRN